MQVIASVNNSLYCGPLEKFGTEEQKKQWCVYFAFPPPVGRSSGSEYRVLTHQVGPFPIHMHYPMMTPLSLY